MTASLPTLGPAPLPTLGPAPLSPLDVASGVLFDARPVAHPLPPTRLSPAAALERAVLPALRRPPCLVSFSGGRDSSLALAAAVRVARRDGLPLPVAITNRFPHAPATCEDDWQEAVIAELRPADWVRLEFTDELDLVGPYAQRGLRRHGLLWPFNVHFLLPLMDAARGGSLVTGLGGDDLFAAATRTLLGAVLARSAPARPRDAARLALALAPRPLRRRVLAVRRPVDYPWLRPQARRAVSRAAAAQSAAEPRTAPGRLAHWLGLRYLREARAALAALGRDGDVALAHPLCAPEVWSAVGAACPPHGFPSHTAALEQLFAEWLSPAILARRDKAVFDGAFWSRHSRRFVSAWNGSGVPAALVDVDALAAHWRTRTPLAQSYSLLQAAWLSSVFPTAGRPHL